MSAQLSNGASYKSKMETQTEKGNTNQAYQEKNSFYLEILVINELFQFYLDYFQFLKKKYFPSF